MSNIGKHMVAQGRVQGVGFRYFCQREAFEENITGFVRNMANGDVEIVAEGDETQIEIFINNIQNNHPYAKVFNLTQKNVPFTGKYKGFSISY